MNSASPNENLSSPPVNLPANVIARALENTHVTCSNDGNKDFAPSTSENACKKPSKVKRKKISEKNMTKRITRSMLEKNISMQENASNRVTRSMKKVSNNV